MDPRFSADALKQIIKHSGCHFIENSKSYIFDCPLCHKLKKLYIRKADGRFVCWKCKEDCNFYGKPEYALTELMGVSISEIKNQLYGGGGVLKDDNSHLELELKDFYSDTDEIPTSECELPEVVWSPLFVGPDRPIFCKALAYLDSRGIPESFIADYQIKYDPITQRVIIPVFVESKLRGWQARLINNNQIYGPDGNPVYNPKILSTKGLSGGSVFMFQDRLKCSPHAVLAEGPFDAMKAHLCGGNVASMGKEVTKRQLMVLVMAGIKKLYVALDPDAANEIMKLAQEMYELELYRLEPPPGRGDLGDATLAEVHKMFMAAERFTPSRLFVHLDPPKPYRGAWSC